ncbi:MAG TPA: iron-containing alcohol dehydrogenase [Acidobacteriota bacterium]|nr:iron-containing alcohol dehydrogenase [Acidobacteriota bacterium]
MTLRFEFATATRIVFGPGVMREAASTAASLGSRALVVTGATPERACGFIAHLRSLKLECAIYSLRGEPTIPAILEGIRAAKEAGAEVVVGFGGGSALDGAKAIAALLTNPGAPLDYLEVVGSGNPLTRPCAPCICVPTTAGTGCEVTRNSVLISPEHKIKISLRSPHMAPLLAAVDPDLTHSLLPSITAGTGLDALTQLIEPFLSVRANPLTDSLCREGIGRVAAWLRICCNEGGNSEARRNMALASLFGGLALANAGLGAVHGLAAPLGGMFPVPHGVACAALLPGAMAVNLRALRSRCADSPVLDRFDEIARMLTGNPSACAEEGIEWIAALCADLELPRLSSFGLEKKDLPIVARQAGASSSIKGNPIPLTADELAAIAASAL